MRRHTYLVIGAGMMGRAAAKDLARADDTRNVIVADIDEEKAQRVVSEIGREKGRAVRLDAASHQDIVSAMKHADCAIGAASYTMNEHLSRGALEAGCSFLDLGGNTSVVESQKKLDGPAREKGICIIPNCGLAPGMALVLAAGGAKEYDELETIHIRVGGLPRDPVPPFNYQKVFAIEGLINEYSGDSELIEDGEIARAPALTGLEHISFPPPFERLEAFHTSGGTSMLPRMFKGRVKELSYKTIRYPGHCERMRALFDAGFASMDPIQLGSHVFTERELFLRLLEKKLPSNGPDVVLVRVEITGSRSGRRIRTRFQIVDFGDESDNISAMMRSTAYPTSWIAQMVSRSIIERKGVATPEECVPLEPFLTGVKDRGIEVERTETPVE